METRRYISVILPLKLEWEPCYYYLPVHRRDLTADINWNNAEAKASKAEEANIGSAEETESSSVELGHRVRVRFANKEYVGVVSGVDITPEIAPSKILPLNTAGR